MSYYKKYRKNQKELKCLLENDSNIGEKNKIPVQSKEFRVPLKELQESTIKNITVSSMNVSEGLTEENLWWSYLYLGIRSGVVQILDSLSLKVNEISLDVNIDGLPLFKSSKLHLWSILGSFVGSNVFVIGLFSGTSKPDCVNEFMEDFILEVNELKQTPITFGD